MTDKSKSIFEAGNNSPPPQKPTKKDPSTPNMIVQSRSEHTPEPQHKHDEVHPTDVNEDVVNDNDVNDKINPNSISNSDNKQQAEEKDEPKLPEKQQAEEKDELIQDIVEKEEQKEEQFETNSIGAAKKKYIKNKGRDSHKYDLGSPRSSHKKNRRDSLLNKIEDNIEEYKVQIEQNAEQLLLATDEYVSKLSASTGINFAPLNIPLKRRRQTFAVLIYSCLYFIFLLLNFLAIRYWTGIKFYIYLLFLSWKLFYQKFHKNGGLPIPWLRSAFFWKWFVDFFPIRLHKTYNLDSTGSTSYLFGYHPHGIIGMGAVGTFSMMASGFNKLFPAIDVRLLTLRINFFIPFFDLYLTFMGMCDASRESCNAILSDEDNTHRKSICLVLGGAKESLEAHSGIVQLYLKNRKGFIKVALENGASLVPVFGFGENELFSQIDNPQGSAVRNLQNTLQKRMGFAIPLFYGRGVFQYNYGLLPRRQPINVVFGKPIKCRKYQKSEITNELINEYHNEYCKELKAVFDENKAKFYLKSEKIPELHFI